MQQSQQDTQPVSQRSPALVLCQSPVTNHYGGATFRRCPTFGVLMDDDKYLKKLQADISREIDPQVIRKLIAELDHFINNKVKRARRLPNVETR